MDIPGAPDHNGLDPLVAHHRPDAAAAGAGATLFDGGEIDPVLARRADGRHLGLGFFQFLADQLGRLHRPFASEVRGVADLDLVVLDPDVDQVGRFAAQDYLVIAGVLQFRRPESAHH